MIYGYCRISTKSQNIERQKRNIKSAYPEAVIVSEIYTGTKQDRPEWIKLINKISTGDVIVFDEVSRMSRNAKEGFETYKELFERNIELVFLKESHINTESYKEAMQNIFIANINCGDLDTNELVNAIMQAINKFMLNKIEKDIYGAFEQAQKEVEFLHQRTREGIATARLNGKQIGRKTGTIIKTKKSINAKKDILKYNRDFDGALSDVDCMKLLKLSRNTYYKYKREIKESRV